MTIPESAKSGFIIEATYDRVMTVWPKQERIFNYL